MKALAPRPVVTTYPQLEDVPDTMVAERIDDVVYASPRPASPHARAHGLLLVALSNAFEDAGGPGERPGGWLLLTEPELHFERDVVVPDLAAWRRERMPRMPDAAHFTLAPDWVCEVLSPSTARLDRSKKLGVYARAGVGHVWLLDPLQQLLEVLRLEGDHYGQVATHAGEDVARAEPFAALALPLARLWSR